MPPRGLPFHLLLSASFPLSGRYPWIPPTKEEKAATVLELLGHALTDKNGEIYGAGAVAAVRGVGGGDGGVGERGKSGEWAEGWQGCTGNRGSRMVEDGAWKQQDGGTARRRHSSEYCV